ncbi:MAG: RraA family protein [Betaproteobacteria bacterium]
MTPLHAKLLSFDTATVSDALDTLGVNGGLAGIQSLDRQQKKIVGPAYTIRFEPVVNGESAPAADYIDNVPAGAVIVLDNGGRTHCTVWGGILSSVGLSKNIAGTVINGLCRDVDSTLAVGFPVFSLGSYMKSGKNRVRMVAEQIPVTIGETTVHPGDIILGDLSGVIAIPAAIAEQIAVKAAEIMAMEKQVLESLSQGMTLRAARQKHKYNSFAFRPGEHLP